jgi:hypothetical protein
MDEWTTTNIALQFALAATTWSGTTNSHHGTVLAAPLGACQLDHDPSEQFQQLEQLYN